MNYSKPILTGNESISASGLDLLSRPRWTTRSQNSSASIFLGPERVKDLPSPREVCRPNRPWSAAFVVENRRPQSKSDALALTPYWLRLQNPTPKGKDYTKSDEISRLITDAETVPYDNDDIPSFFIDKKDECFDIGQTEDDKNEFGEPKYAESDELIVTMDDPASLRNWFEPISIDEILAAQLNNKFCAEIRLSLHNGGRLFFVADDNGILVCRGNKGDEIGTLHPLKERLFYIKHYYKLAGNPGGRRLYHRIRRGFNWSAIVVDHYATVRDFPHWARNSIKLRKNTGKLQLFSALAPLTSVCINILSELNHTYRKKKYLLVITVDYTKLTKKVPMKGTSTEEVAKHFMNAWVFNYGLPEHLMEDNSDCFCIKGLSGRLEHHGHLEQFQNNVQPQNNGQVELFNRKILAALRTCVEDHLSDWELYTDALTYAYNWQLHTSMCVAPFELVLFYPPVSLAVKPMTSMEEPQDEFKRNCKN